ncbi:MAG: PKD domain-containing protein [Flavobacteriales bacterium]|nr:PKD domain-containing protein [Flavobacteriales bacterium]
MRLTTLSLLAFLGNAVLAQTPPLERLYTIPGALEIHGAARDDAGNFYIANETPGGDIQVTRISATGEHEWTKAYPFISEDGLYGNSIAVGPEGVVVAGYVMDQSGIGLTNSRDGVILRIDPEDGALLTSTRIDNGSSNALHYLWRTPDGFIASGRSDAAGRAYDMLLAKLNDLGEVQWCKTYGPARTPNDNDGWQWGYEAKPLADGGFAVVGYGDGLGTGYSPSGYLVRTDALGNELWARGISSGAGVDELYTVVESTTGDLYVGGRSLGFVLGGVTAFITKISSTGAHIWTRTLEHGIQVGQLLPRADGGVDWLASPQYLPGGGGGGAAYDIAWGAFNADGDLLRANLYGSEASENGMVFFQTDNGGHAIMGFTSPQGRWEWSEGDPMEDYWRALLILTDADGHSDCGDIDLALNWVSATANVIPVTSLYGSGFTSFPYPMGELAMAVGSSNPCCNEVAAFTMERTGDFSWRFLDGSTGANSYAWDFGDGNTSTEQSPPHTYAGNGTYNVCLTITGDCASATTCQQVSVTVGLDEVAGQAVGVSLYPSPASDIFVVRSERSAIALVQLVDTDGRLVGTTAGNHTGSMIVPVDQLSNGLYVARVQLFDGTMHHQRVMVAH